MSERVVRTSAGRTYSVRVERGLQPALAEVLATIGGVSRTIVVTDRTVQGCTGERAASLGDAVVVVAPGEASKSVEQLGVLWERLRSAGCDRGSLILALGGGVVGDLAGFATATYMRGVRVLHLPTTLLAMVDSAVGGKTAINLGAKNLVGAFHQPVGVVADLSVLATLPPREVRCGLGEVWKTAILSGEPLLERVERDAAALCALDVEALEPVIAACVEHKASVVERDEREAGERALLNFGHTLGHALEVLDARLSHGEAVVVGGLFACTLAEGLGWLDPTLTARFRSLAEALGLPCLPTQAVDPEALLSLMGSDKKAQAGTLRWVLPRGVGRCEVTADVSQAAVREALAALGFAAPSV